MREPVVAAAPPVVEPVPFGPPPPREPVGKRQPRSVGIRDPLSRHERRYFDGKGWSDIVADGGVRSSDASARSRGEGQPSGEATQREATQREAPQREAPQREAPQREAPQREAPQREAPQRDAPQREVRRTGLPVRTDFRTAKRPDAPREPTSVAVGLAVSDALLG